VQTAVSKPVAQPNQFSVNTWPKPKGSGKGKWVQQKPWVTKAGKRNGKWSQESGQSAGLNQGSKQFKKLIDEKLKGGDVQGAFLHAKNAGAAAAKVVLPALLEAAAQKLGPSQYSEILALGVRAGLELDVTTFTRILVVLMSRVPVPTGMVRLTLNLGIPKDGQVVPLFPPDATEAEQRAVFQDGELIPSSEPLSKELGAQSVHRGDAEDQGGQALSKVQPAELRGRVRLQNAQLARYFGHFVALLHLEMLVELTAMKRRLERPPEMLEPFGWMVRGLQVRSAETNRLGKSSGGLPGREGSRSRVRIVFLLPAGTDISRLRMRAGDSVLLSRVGPLQDLLGEGIVAEAPKAEEEDGAPRGFRAEQRIVVTYDGAFDEQAAKSGSWRLDCSANRTAYERQFMALLKMMLTTDPKRWPVWNILTLTDVGGDNVDDWAGKMRVMLDDKHRQALKGEDGMSDVGNMADSSTGLRTPAKACTRAQNLAAAGARKLQTLSAEEPELPHWRAAEAVKRARLALRTGAGEDANSDVQQLNVSQREAVAAALGRRLTMVQGPPGTGKTTVSVQLLSTWAKSGVRPLLATSDSNIAVDNIAEGLQKLGLKVVRVGRPEKVTANLEGIVLESILRKQQQREEGDKAEDELQGHRKGSSKGSSKGSVADAKQKRMDDFEAKMTILKEADVICTTTIASGSDFLHLLKLQAILIDEVAQATELSAMVPIVLRGAERLVLVGDHCQLPPNVCSLEAETRGLSLSLFGRLVAQGLEPYFLDTQFRMHPMIAHFSANDFYHGKLQTGVSAEDRPPPDGFAWPQSDSGIAFVDVGGWERKDGESRTNPAEVAAVVDILTEILATGLSVLDVGVVTPYAAQVRALRQSLRRELPTRLSGSSVDLSGGLEGRNASRALEVASVDAFQGREKELIIFSAVRSNREGNMGFLADWRRLNVMITRARRGLIVVGNMATLRKDATWARWLDWADESGFVIASKDQMFSSKGRLSNEIPAPPRSSSSFGGAQSRSAAGRQHSHSNSVSSQPPSCQATSKYGAMMRPPLGGATPVTSVQSTVPARPEMQHTGRREATNGLWAGERAGGFDERSVQAAGVEAKPFSFVDALRAAANEVPGTLPQRVSSSSRAASFACPAAAAQDSSHSSSSSSTSASAKWSNARPSQAPRPSATGFQCCGPMPKFSAHPVPPSGLHFRAPSMPLTGSLHVAPSAPQPSFQYAPSMPWSSLQNAARSVPHTSWQQADPSMHQAIPQFGGCSPSFANLQCMPRASPSLPARPSNSQTLSMGPGALLRPSGQDRGSAAGGSGFLPPPGMGQVSHFTFPRGPP